MTAEMACSGKRAAVLIASDRVAAGEATDSSGNALADRLTAAGWIVAGVLTCPDDIDAIADTLVSFADREQVALVITTGGTGIAARDVTPDATRRIADREVPGIAEALRSASLEQTAHAMLSRATAAIRGATLIVNLPGSERGAISTFDALSPVLDHAVALLQDHAVDRAGHEAADR